MMPRGFGKLKKYDEPLTTKAAAELVEVSARTLMHYEKLRLVFPERKGKIRLYSAHDIKWLRCLRELIHGGKISLGTLQKLLKRAPCWELKHCPRNVYTVCVKSSGNHFTVARKAPRSGKPSSGKATTSSSKRAIGNRRINKA
jgi:hypothetical protein